MRCTRSWRRERSRGARLAVDGLPGGKRLIAGSMARRNPLQSLASSCIGSSSSAGTCGEQSKPKQGNDLIPEISPVGLYARRRARQLESPPVQGIGARAKVAQGRLSVKYDDTDLGATVCIVRLYRD